MAGKAKSMEKEKTFAEVFEDLKFQFRYFSKERIMVVSLELLRGQWGKSVIEIAQGKFHNPWLVFLIMKWGLIYGTDHRVAPKPFGEAEFNALYNQILDLPANSTLGIGAKNSELGFWKFIRCMMHGQIHYQYQISYYGAAVLKTIKEKVGINYDVDAQLEKLSGLRFNDFLEIQVFTCAAMQGNSQLLNYEVDYFKGTYSKYPKDKILKLLNFSSLNFHELSEFFKEDHEWVANPEYEYSLITPLIRKPLFRNYAKFTPLHPVHLQYYINFGAYDNLRESDKSHFPQQFGIALEDYAKIPLSNVAKEILRESDLKTILGQSSVVDYALPSKSNCVLLEIKTAEMYPLTFNDPQVDYFRRTYNSSIIKAYIQIFTAAQKLMQMPQYAPISKWFGVIVMYKEQFLGTPSTMWEEFVKDSLLQRSDLPFDVLNPPFPPENIITTCIADLDLVCEYCRKHGIEIGDALSTVIENNKDKGHQSLFLRDHFKDKDFTWMSISHVYQSFTEIMESIREGFQKTGSG